MSNVVIVDAVRTPIGTRNGGLSTIHPAELLGTVQKAIVERTGIDPTEIGQVVGGCVSQVGEQAFNITRTAWLAAGLPLTTAATTVDTQCGSSQQATNLATALVGSGVVDVALACGVEVMSRIPIGVSGSKALGLGVPIPKTYFEPLRDDVAVRGRRAHRRQVGHHPRGHRRVRLRAASSAPPRPGPRIASPASTSRSRRPTSTRRASPPARPTTSTRDEGLRETTLEKLATLKPVARENGVHTAGNSSQISDGAVGRAADDRGEGRRARPHAPGPHRRHLPRRRRSRC